MQPASEQQQLADVIRQKSRYDWEVPAFAGVAGNALTTSGSSSNVGGPMFTMSNKKAAATYTSASTVLKK